MYRKERDRIFVILLWVRRKLNCARVYDGLIIYEYNNLDLDD